MIFLWSQKGLGGHSALGVKTDIWVRAVGYQQLVGAATLGGGLTSHTGGRKSSCGIKTDIWVGPVVGYQQLVEAASLGGGLLTSYTGLEEDHYGSTG